MEGKSEEGRAARYYYNLLLFGGVTIKFYRRNLSARRDDNKLKT